MNIVHLSQKTIDDLHSDLAGDTQYLLDWESDELPAAELLVDWDNYTDPPYAKSKSLRPSSGASFRTLVSSEEGPVAAELVDGDDEDFTSLDQEIRYGVEVNAELTRMLTVELLAAGFAVEPMSGDEVGFIVTTPAIVVPKEKT